MTLAGPDLLVLVLAGVGLGFANTLASSGSAISLPVLLAYGLDAEVANGTNRVAVLAAALASFQSFARSGRIQWPLVVPLMVACAIGSVAGAGLSESVPPARLHLVIVGALLIAMVILFARPARWLTNAGEQPRVGPIQLLLVFLVGVWMGFIFLDSGTYLLFVLVLSVRFSLAAANAAKAALVTVSALTAVPVLIAGNQVDWSLAGCLSVGAVIGGVVAARAALVPGADRWIYRLIVAMVVGEVAHLAFSNLRL